jgi:hypothetical protein
VMLVAGDDYTVAGDALTLDFPCTANSTVQWDLLVPSAALTPGHVNAYKVTIAPAPDGTLRDFNLTYLNPISGNPAPTEIGSGAQLLVSLDGCVQEPGVAYTASGSTLTFTDPPHATAEVWAVWYQPGEAP